MEEWLHQRTLSTIFCSDKVKEIVGTKEHCRKNALAVFQKVCRQKIFPGKREGNQHNRKEHWQYSSCSSFIKFQKTKRTCFKKFIKYDSCYQIATDDEKDINTDVTTLKPITAKYNDFSVVQNNDQNRYRSESIYFGSAIYRINFETCLTLSGDRRSFSIHQKLYSI